MTRLILATVAIFVLGTNGAFGGEKESADALKAAGTADPKNEIKAKGRSTDKQRSKLAEFAKVCGLSDEQQKRLMDINEAREKAVQEINAKTDEQVVAVLSPEQKAKWNETIAMSLVQRDFGKVSLTDEQIGRIKAEIATRTKDILLALNEKSSQMLRELMTFTKDKVLTEDQKTAIKVAPRNPVDLRKPPEVDMKKFEKKPEGQ
ncbi:MAG: hypothetical protein WCN95_08265 [bacterium]